jgi:class 3 adenylate cyclase
MKGKLKDAVILFIDLENSFFLSEVLGPEKYADLLYDYQSVSYLLLVEEFGESPDPSQLVWEIRGDEVCLFLYRDILGDLRSALSLAFKIKWRWLLGTKTNRERLELGHSPFGLGIGIHLGKVILGDFPSGWQYIPREFIESAIRLPVVKFIKQITVEEYAISFAKRVEGTSRQAKYTGIMLSRSASHVVIEHWPAFHLSSEYHTEIKAFPQRLPVREVISYKPSPYELKSSLSGWVYLGKEMQANEDFIRRLNVIFDLRPTDFFLGWTLFVVYFDLKEYLLAEKVLDKMRWVAEDKERDIIATMKKILKREAVGPGLCNKEVIGI